MAWYQQSPSDTTRSENEQFYLNQELKYLINNRLFLGQNNYDYLNVTPKQISFYGEKAETKSLLQLKSELKNYLTARKNLLPNYDLGEFGKYLGYANTLAVILLAISHVSKYGFK